MNNKYVVKNLTPWMIDELIAFSLIEPYELILLRKPDHFYKESLDELVSNGVKVFEKPFSNKNSLKKIFFLLKFILYNLSKFRPDYNLMIGLKSVVWFFRLDLTRFDRNSNIHAQFTTQPALLSVMVKDYYGGTPKVSCTFHAYDIYFKNRWFNFIVDKCFKAFSISRFNIDYITKEYGSFDNVRLSRLGVFRDKIHQKPVIEDATAKEGLQKILRIGLISWFVKKKGIGYLLEALIDLKKNGIQVKFLLAGDGPLKDTYLTFIEENDLSDMVEYMGKIKGDEKQMFYDSIDLFVLPSIKLKNDQDGIPVVLMEAIANGLPIISTNVSGIPEICIDQYNGRLIPERNKEALVTSISELSKDKDQLNIYAKNSLILSNEYDIMVNSKKKIIDLNWISN